MAASRGGGWSGWAAVEKGSGKLGSIVIPGQYDRARLEELNLLLKCGLKRVEFNPEDNWWAEDGFAPDDNDPLEYVEEGNLPEAEPYKVLYKMIAIRKQPSAEAKVLGTAQMGDILPTYGWDSSREWRKTHFMLRGGWGRRVAAWIMVKHPTLNLLVQPAAESEEEAAEREKAEKAQKAAEAAKREKAERAEKAKRERAKSEKAERGRAERAEPPAPAARAEREAAQAAAGAGAARQPALQPPQEAGAGAPAQPPAAQDALAAPVARPSNPVPVGAEELEDAARKLEDMVEQICSAETEDGEPMDLPTQTPEGFIYATVAEMDEAAEDGGLQYQVVYKPFVAMRHTAHATKGKVVNSVEYGSYVDTFGWDKKKKWRKLFCKMPTDGRIIVTWMMVSNSELGPLLQPAAG